MLRSAGGVPCIVIARGHGVAAGLGFAVRTTNRAPIISMAGQPYATDAKGQPTTPPHADIGAPSVVPSINHLSLCTGYGGIDLGLAAVLPGLRTVCYVEREAFAIANLGASMEAGNLHQAPIWDDLQTFDGTPWRGVVDILSGGFPCQPFSCAGKRRADDDSRHLWPQITRIIDECRPRVVFLENVEGIISAKLGGRPETSVLKHVLCGLHALGFVATAGIYSAEECGAPHRRKRVFIAGVVDAGMRSMAERPPVSCDLGWCPRTDQCIEECEECTPEDLRHRAGVADAQGFPTATGKECSGGARTTGGGVKLADAHGAGLQVRPSIGKNPRQECTPTERSSSKARNDQLAHTDGGRCGQSIEQATPRDAAPKLLEQLPHATGWPTRPGEPQRPEEPPRTIEPRLGRDADGTTHRVNRLRLLGNGCVPQTVALAFMDLMGQLLNE